MHGRDAVLHWRPEIDDHAMENRMNTGKVTLVSAGPGDLDLLTFKAAKAITAAITLSFIIFKCSFRS